MKHPPLCHSCGHPAQDHDKRHGGCLILLVVLTPDSDDGLQYETCDCRETSDSAAPEVQA